MGLSVIENTTRLGTSEYNEGGDTTKETDSEWVQIEVISGGVRVEVTSVLAITVIVLPCMSPKRRPLNQK